MLYLFHDGTLYPIFYLLNTVHFEHIITILPELFLLSFLLLLLIYIVFFQYNVKTTILDLSELNRVKMKSFLTTIYFYIFIFSIVAVVLFETLTNKGVGLLAFDDHLIMDYYSYLAKMVIVLASIILFFMIHAYFRQENIVNFEFLLILGFSLFGLLIFLSTFELFLMYIALELVSLTLYILAMFRTNVSFSAEAGIKYITLGAISSGIMLFGISLLYGNLIHLDYLNMKNFFFYCQDFPIQVTFNSSFFFGMLCVFFGFLFKIAAVPLHMWSVDVYEGVPLIVTAFFAVIVKFGIFWVFLRLLFYVFIDFIEVWREYFLIFGVLSIVVGAFGAITQKNIKRLIAYSSINHVGYLLLGVCTGTFTGAQSVILYLLVYVLANLLFFLLLINTYDSQNSQRLVFVSDFTSLGKQNFFLGICFSIAVLSLAGIPPLAGFFSKYYLFLALIESGFYLYALFAIVFSVISAFYYLRIVKLIFFENVASRFSVDKVAFNAIFFISLITLIILGFVFYQEVFFEICNRAARILTVTFGFSVR